MSKHKGLGPVCGRHRRHWALRTRRKPFHVACDNKCLSGNCETNYRRLLRDTYLWQSCLCLRAFQEPLCPYHASKTYRMKHPDTLSKNRLTSSVLIDCANMYSHNLQLEIAAFWVRLTVYGIADTLRYVTRMHTPASCVRAHTHSHYSLTVWKMCKDTKNRPHENKKR